MYGNSLTKPSVFDCPKLHDFFWTNDQNVNLFSAIRVFYVSLSVLTFPKT